MIIEYDSGMVEHFICPCVNCKAILEENIPTFFSYKHALDSGWVYTKETKYCDPDNCGGVWVCPACYKNNKENKQ